MSFSRIILSRRNRHPSLPQRRTASGTTLVETSIAIALLGLIAATALATLVILNKNAASARIMTGAREIVQRNIESAVGSAFTTNSLPPNGILNLTGTNGAVWDENGGTSPVTIFTNRDGTATVTGTLTRTVVAEPSAVPAPTPDIRRVTFHLDYSLFGRAMSYEMITLRAVDK
jgi:Tfp pilus assembly protein FimT